MSEQPPNGGRVVTLLHAARQLTLTNVLVIALLVMIAVPVYIVWRALGDEKIMDRLMSTYEVIDTKQGCLVRHVQERGGPDLWGVSSGFAFQGRDRWYVNVLLEHMPSDDEVAAYCASLKLIADRMLERGSLHTGSVPSTQPDRRRYGWDMPAAEEEK